MPVEPSAAPASLPISALPRIGELIDGAQDILKADISRIKQLLVDPDAILPQPIVAFTLQEAKDALDLLAVHARQLAAWQRSRSAMPSGPRSCACGRSSRTSAR